MTRRRKKSSTRRTTRRKKKSGNSLLSLLLILVIAGFLFLGNRFGLIEVDVQAFLEEALTLIDAENSLGDAFNPPPAPVVVEPVTGDWYRLYFTSPHYPDDPATHVDSIVTGLIDVIDSAQTRLDIAIFELNLDEVADAILAAQSRGVTVRLVTDTDSLEETAALRRLEEAGVPLVGDERSALMHNKFVIVDEKAVWTGSWNFTHNGTYRNNNHALYIQSPELAQTYRVEFEEMFLNGAFGPTSPANTLYPRLIIGETQLDTCFAAEDGCAAQVISAVEQAQTRLEFMAFSFTHAGLGQAVRERAAAGVAVRGVFETRGSETEFSEFGAMRRQNLAVLQDGNPYTLHHKVFIIDAETVILGSFNFSNNADTANDENLLIIRSPDLARQFLAEFDRVYSLAQNPPE